MATLGLILVINVVYILVRCCGVLNVTVTSRGNRRTSYMERICRDIRRLGDLSEIYKVIQSRCGLFIELWIISMLNV